MTDIDMNVVQMADSASCQLESPDEPAFKYPEVRRDETFINYYPGDQEIVDPYEYLEDSSREDTRSFVQDQKNFFNSLMAKSTSSALIRKNLTDLWNYPKIGIPMKKGIRIFFWENSGLQNQNVLYVKDSEFSQPRVLLDINEYQRDGTLSVEVFGISNDGQYLGYALSENGSDWLTIRVRDVRCGHDLHDTLKYAKLTAIRWTKDSKGFFYQRFPAPMKGYESATGTQTELNINEKVYYHQLGTLQVDDIPILGFLSHPTWLIGIEMSDDGDYLFVYASDVIGEKHLFSVSLKEGISENMKMTRLMNTPGVHWYLANDANIAFFVTNVGAPNSQVVRIDLNNPTKANWTIIVPEHPKNVIDWAMVVNQNKLIICYMENVVSKIEIRDLYSGNPLQQLESYEVGTASGYYGRRMDSDFFFKINSYVNPGIIYQVKFSENGKSESKIIKKTPIKSIDLSKIKMEYVTYSSNDGTNIPLFLIHRQDMKLDSNRPCLLTAYGGFFSSNMPVFTPAYLLFARNFNGVVAVSNIRGGGEFGKNWWDNGRLLKKMNSFVDFTAAAEYLINNGYTNKNKLAIEGQSNGGLLISAVVNLRPELFGAAIPQVPITDMLRFHKFTLGHLWIGEYGSPDNETFFNYIRKYSPLHNIRLPQNESVQYPAVLVTTADHDDRVVPSHSYKYIAELQNTIGSSSRQKNPLLIRIDTKAGHGYGKPTSKRIDQWTDIFSFLQLTLGYEFSQFNA